MILHYRNLSFLCVLAGFLYSLGNITELSYKKRTIISDGRIDQNINNIMLADEEYKSTNTVLNADKIIDTVNNIIKLDKKSPYGFTQFIYDFKEEEYFHISVWRYGDNEDGILVADGLHDDRFYYGQNKPDLIDTAGWQLLTLDIFIPPYYNFDELRIYVWNKGTDTVIFKDLKIERTHEKIYPSFKQLSLQINTDEAAVEKLRNKRYFAFKNGVLQTEDNDYVKAQLIYGSDTMKADIRLKGDWLDHLIGPKWSFRVNMSKNHSWKEMTTFSLQTPQSRGFLDEWLTHKIFTSEDVLTTRYGFVPVIFNGKSLGIYAYEEHFDRHLVESNNRREGPIIKFSEDAFWTTQRLYISEGKNYNIPMYEATDILPFKMNRTLANEYLFNEYLIAQNLLYQFKNDLRPVSEILDIKKLAKYYALSDITRAYHGFKWHNIRFYYNPVICRLEPVAFDLYTSEGINSPYDNIIIGDFQKSDKISKIDNILIAPLKQKEFVNEYTCFLSKYSKDNFLDSLYNSLFVELDSLSGLLKKEFGIYKFDISPYKASCKNINEFLENFREMTARNDYGVRKVQQSEYDRNIPGDLVPYLIKIYRNRYMEDSIFYLDNFCKEKLRLSGFGNIDTLCSITDIIEIPERTFNYPLRIDHPDLAEYLAFKVGDREELFSIPVFQWNLPYDYSPAQELINNYKFENHAGIKNNSDTLIIEGTLNISKPLVIPSGYIVIIKEGAKIDFTDKSTFISYSPVFARGTKSQPIRITSSDGTAMGFNVFQAQEKSVFENAVFDQLNTLDYNGWTLTGAVNFYDSDVELSDVTFRDNRCEDALNIIRSEFVLTGCTFDNIFADAFDSDFSNGSIKNSLFRDMANDAMDLSGSKVAIENCEIINAGDKGISCGEKSELIAANVKVNRTNIAITSKDLSKLTVSNSLISNSNYSFVAFRKKPEYGEAEIYSINNTLKKILNGPIIEIGSTLFIDGKVIPGTYKKVASRFYIN